MDKIASFSCRNLNDVKASMAAALAKVEKEFGLKIAIDNVKWTPNSFNAQLYVITGADDVMLNGVNPKHVHEIKKWNETRDLFMRKMSFDGIPCTIVGIRPRTNRGQVVIRKSSNDSLCVVDIALVRDKLIHG
jgi:hypothetical protein